MTGQIQKSKRILVGIDYSTSSNNALEYATGLAERSGASLVLFHVYDFPVLHTNAGLYMMDYRAIKREDLARLEDLKNKTQAKHPKLGIEVLNSNLGFH